MSCIGGVACTPQAPTPALRVVHVPQVRGRGLLNAVVIDDSHGISAWDICLRLMREGLLTKPTHGAEGSGGLLYICHFCALRMIFLRTQKQA
jgi:hypothetical protein